MLFIVGRTWPSSHGEVESIGPGQPFVTTWTKSGSDAISSPGHALCSLKMLVLQTQPQHRANHQLNPGHVVPVHSSSEAQVDSQHQASDVGEKVPPGDSRSSCWITPAPKSF